MSVRIADTFIFTVFSFLKSVFKSLYLNVVTLFCLELIYSTTTLTEATQTKNETNFEISQSQGKI